MSYGHANSNGRNDDPSQTDNDNMPLAQVAIADDDPDALELLAEVLRPLTVQVHKASSGAELVVLLAEHGPFDLIVTDIDMPWMEGLGVIRSARAAEIETPVLFVSGIARADLEASVGRLSNARILRKPVAIADLRHVASQMLVAWEARRLHQRHETGQRSSGPAGGPRPSGSS
jgi:two-component system cell cycle response regulator CpdR